jgi:ATP-dependent DNA ligase
LAPDSLIRNSKRFSTNFEPSEVSPFSNSPTTSDVKWLKPKLVLEVVALEVSKRRHLRAPVFLRRRTDKVPEECTIDQLDLSESNGSL